MEGLASYEVTVSETIYISPNVKKIRFSGNLSRMNFQIGYANVIRVSDTEFRNYTAAYYDTQKGVLDMIIHIHGNGPGSQYIDTLNTGDTLRISIPRGQKQYDPRIKKQMIFGDETTLALASSFLPVLKKHQHDFQFYFELDEANKEAPLLLGFENYTIFPKNGLFRDENQINDLPLFKTDGWQTANFILSGNVRSVQTFRRALKNNNVPGKIYAKGYWLEGKTGL